MAFLDSINISASALTAQRMRLDIIAENVANMNNTRTEGGGPYRRKMVVFESIDGGRRGSFRSKLANEMTQSQPRAGVKVTEIVEDERPFKPVYNPEHPDADENGYVLMPNVELLKETADSMAATRAYEANVTVINAIKAMASKALEVGR